MNTTVTSVNFRLISTIPISWTVIVKRWATPEWCGWWWMKTSNIRCMVPTTRNVRNTRPTWFIRKHWSGWTNKTTNNRFSAYWLTPYLMRNSFNRKIPSWMNTKPNSTRTKSLKEAKAHDTMLLRTLMLNLQEWLPGWIITWVKSWKSWKRKGWTKTHWLFSPVTTALTKKAEPILLSSAETESCAD